MVIHDYDNETSPVVSLEHFYGKPKHIVDKCLILFSKVIHDHLLERYACRRIATIGQCNGNIPIYSFEHAGEQIAFYLSGIGSAIAADLCYQAHWLTGAEKFIMFGSCGSLDQEATRGRYIIPTESYRGEGCSYYFAPPADYITVRNADKVAAVFDEIGAPYAKGRVWTTDSMLRETSGLVQKRKQEGCIAVEMEVAGVQAICDFYGLELFDFLEAGDVLDESDYDITDLPLPNRDLVKLIIALEIDKRL